MTRNLLALILELQGLDGFSNFALAGGSNLAVRFQHRNSVDIDLFSDQIIGVQGWEMIQQALRYRYGEALLFSDILNKELGEQYCFLRALIIKGEEQIKLDMIQNIQFLDTPEEAEFTSSNRHHTHSNDRLDLLENSKTWASARLSWKKKVKKLADLSS